MSTALIGVLVVRDIRVEIMHTKLPVHPNQDETTSCLKQLEVLRLNSTQSIKKRFENYVTDVRFHTLCVVHGT